jgi:hypothetical protein
LDDVVLQENQRIPNPALIIVGVALIVLAPAKQPA